MKTSMIGMIEWVLVLAQAPALSCETGADVRRYRRAGPQAGGFVVRNENAYPMIRMGHQDYVDWRRTWIARFENLWLFGQSGIVRHNDQYHEIAKALLAARTVLVLGRYDPWRVNIDAEYRSGAAA